jgi:hypothetical protein
MPPRKIKPISKDDASINESPVIFFLKIGDQLQCEKNVIPSYQSLTYSEILNTVETSKNTERFNVDLLKTILETTAVNRYNEQTVCFWCCHGFNWPASVLPITFDTYKNIFKAHGNFCSPECALAYNYADSRISDSTKWHQHALLGKLYSKLYTMKTLSPAPSRSILRMFGGVLDIEQFRDYTSSTNELVLSELPPIRLQFPSMNVQGPLRDVKRYVCLSVDVVEKATEQLRLKRSKPVNTNIQTLDMCMKPTKA